VPQLWAKILQLNDPRIDPITVPGELVVQTGEGIRTRSKSSGPTVEQWTSIPLKLKIVQILLQEYEVIEEEANPQPNSLDDDEEEEESNEITGNFVFADEFMIDEDLDDEKEDPDAQNDLIFQLSLKKYVEDMMRNLAKQDPNAFMTLGRQLNSIDQEALQQIVTGNI